MRSIHFPIAYAGQQTPGRHATGYFRLNALLANQHLKQTPDVSR
ncbi:MAG: hypothetical protein NZ699_10070 [Roseiflexus sp.]|nr:hypothetical protein [Roseiflexus sp.]MCS7289462.1 hypothetical protein [Roseiflexus sp.]MDW8233835.1 hypothetical protein [Roseiflexaceae bacterium]